MKQMKAKMQKVPEKLEEFKENLKQKQDEFDEEKERINGLLSDAQALGDEVTKAEYPMNDKGRRYKLNELIAARKRKEADIAAWIEDDNDAEEIKKKYLHILPVYK